MRFFIKMESCFQYNYLKNLRKKIIFRKKFSEKQNIKNIRFKKYCSRLLRFTSYSPKFIDHVFLNCQYLSFLKILSIDWFLNKNWSNFFPKEIKKQEINFKIWDFKNSQTFTTENLYINNEIGIQTKTKIEFGFSFIYFEQYSYFHFQKNKILEYWDKIITKKNLTSLKLSLNLTSNSSNKLKKYRSLKLKSEIHYFYLKLFKLQQKLISNFCFYPNSNSKHFFYFQFSLFFRSFILNWAIIFDTISKSNIDLFYKNVFFSTKVTCIRDFFFKYSVAKILFSLKKIHPFENQDDQSYQKLSLFIGMTTCVVEAGMN